MTPAAATAAELDEEHEEHGQLLGTLWRALAATPPLLEVARRSVAELAEDLPGHTLREERGCCPWLARLLPACAAEIAGLRAEHALLVEEVHQLRVALGGEPDAARIAAALRFVDGFRRHVDRERQLTALALEVSDRGRA